MDKGRAIITNTMAWRRYREGSPELLEIRHQYYEAYRLIEKNGWQLEANKYSEKDKEERRELFKPVMDEYYEALITGDKSDDDLKRFTYKLQGFSVDGELEETVKFRVSHNGNYPSKKELTEILNKRREEDTKVMKTFLKEHVKIANCEDFNKESLYTSTKYLKERGLYRLALANIGSAISYNEGMKLGMTSTEDYKPYMYPEFY